MTPQAVHQAAPRTGVLLANLGTPEAPTPAAIRRFLREFLGDRRVVELPRALWLPVLYGFILPLRPRRLAHAYAQIWTAQGSPLLAIARLQQQALQSALGDAAVVELGMRYGAPGIAEALAALERANARRILVLPLYPQYSGTTTASVLDQVFELLGQRRWIPELRTVNSYHDDPAYIAALAGSVREHWQRHGAGEQLLISFHSIPRRCLESGDPYYCHCQKTARLLAQQLGLGEDRWQVAFQSRIGRLPWLQPYTDEVLTRLGQRGVRTLDVICPGFAADCLETLEEVAIRYAEQFAAGGGKLRYVPALNAAGPHIDALAGVVRRAIAGWEAGAPGAASVERVERARAGLYPQDAGA